VASNRNEFFGIIKQHFSLFSDRTDRKPVFHENSDRMVYISNLPYEMKWNVLKDLIREKSGELAHVEVLEDRNGKSKGCAVAEFDSKQAAIKSIDSLHRQDVSGRLIVVKEIRVLYSFRKFLVSLVL
jgi:RNA recognition motif-containing protein